MLIFMSAASACRPVLLRCLAQDTQQTPQQQTPSAVELLEEVRQWASSMGAL